MHMCVDAYVYSCMCVRMHMFINAHAFVCIYVKVYVHVCVYAYESTNIQDFLIPSDHSVDLAIGIGGSCELIEFAHNGHMVNPPYAHT